MKQTGNKVKQRRNQKVEKANSMMVHAAHWLMAAWGTFNVHGYTIDQRLNLLTRFIPEHHTFSSHQLGSTRHLWHHPSKLPWTRQQQNLLSRRDNILSCIMHFWSGQLFTTRAHNKRIAVCVTGEIKNTTHPCDVRTRNTVKFKAANIATDTRAVVHNSSHSAIHPHSHPLPAHVSAQTSLPICCQLRWVTSCVLEKLPNPFNAPVWDKLQKTGRW